MRPTLIHVGLLTSRQAELPYKGCLSLVKNEIQTVPLKLQDGRQTK